MTEDTTQLIEAAPQKIQDLQAKVEESLVRAKEQVTQMGEQLSTRVRERPFVFLAAAAGLGFLGARLLLPRHKG